MYHWRIFRTLLLPYSKWYSKWGIVLYVREDIPTKCVKEIAVSNSFQGFFIELNLRSKKRLLGCLYNAHRDKTIPHFNTVSNVLDKVCADYENLILLGAIHIWRPWKLSNFQAHPPCPCTSKIFPPPWSWTSNFKRNRVCSISIYAIYFLKHQHQVILCLLDMRVTPLFGPVL